MLSRPRSTSDDDLACNDNGHLSALRTSAGPTGSGILAIARRSLGAVTLAYVAEGSMMIAQSAPTRPPSQVDR